MNTKSRINTLEPRKERLQRFSAMLLVALSVMTGGLAHLMPAHSTPQKLKSPPGEIVYDASAGKFWEHEKTFYDGQTVTLRVINLNMYEEKYTLTVDGNDSYNFDLPSALNSLILRRQPGTVTLPEGEGFTSGSINGESGSLLPVPLLVLYANFQFHLDRFERSLVEKDGDFGKGLALNLVQAVKAGRDNVDIKAKVLQVVADHSDRTNTDLPQSQKIILSDDTRSNLLAALIHYRQLGNLPPGNIPTELRNIDAFVKEMRNSFPADTKAPGSPQNRLARIQSSYDEFLAAAQAWKTGLLRWNLNQAGASSIERKFERNKANLNGLILGTVSIEALRTNSFLTAEGISGGTPVDQLPTLTGFQDKFIGSIRLKQLRSDLEAINAEGSTSSQVQKTAAAAFLGRLNELKADPAITHDVGILEKAITELSDPTKANSLPAGVLAGKPFLLGIVAQSRSQADAEVLKQVNAEVVAVNAAIEAIVKFDEDNLAKLTQYLNSIAKDSSRAAEIFVKAIDPDTLPVTATRTFVIGKSDSIKASVKVEKFAGLAEAADSKEANGASTAASTPTPSPVPTTSTTRSVSANVVGRYVLDYSLGLFRTNLKQKNYVITNGTVQNAPSERHNIGLAALAHYSKTSKSSLFPALTLGVGTANDTRYLGGLSLGYRKSNTRLYVTYGAAYGKVSELTNQKVGDAAAAVATTSVNRRGEFVSATFNFSF